jgi:HAD superfamily hydrolase (TIGR01509 family)
MAELRGIIFDVDGTLLISNEAHAHSWVDAFSAFGWEVPFFRVKWLIGMGGDKLLSTLFPGMSDQEGIGHVMSQHRKKVFLKRYAPHLQPAPGAREFVQRVKDEGFELVIATSSKRQELEVLLEKAQVEDLFERATTASDVEESKPSPEPVQAALQTIGLPPENVIMVADTPYDIASAEKAGVRVVAVRTGGWHDDDLDGAVAIYDSPADIVAHYDGSAFAGRRVP